MTRMILTTSVLLAAIGAARADVYQTNCSPSATGGREMSRYGVLVDVSNKIGLMQLGPVSGYANSQLRLLQILSVDYTPRNVIVHGATKWGTFKLSMANHSWKTPPNEDSPSESITYYGVSGDRTTDACD